MLPIWSGKPLRVLALCTGSVMGLATSSPAFTLIDFASRMEKASVAPAATAANNPSATSGRRYTVSDDGCFVVYTSTATNLVSGQIDGNLGSDVFLYQSCGVRTVRLVSHAFAAPLTTAGALGTFSDQPIISPDGAYLVFRSTATNIVPGSYTLGQTNIFLWNRVSDTFALVSHSFLAGNQGGNGNSQNPVISRTATNPFVAFESVATNLQLIDTNGVSDIFRFNSLGGAVTLVSNSITGAQGNGGSFNPDINGAGDCVVFESGATNLVNNAGGDTNGLQDVFRWQGAGNTRLLSHRTGSPATDTQAGNGESTEVSTDDACTRFAFKSTATNLHPGQVENNNGTDVFWAGTTGDATLVSFRDGATNTTGFHPAVPAQPLVSYSPIISRTGLLVAYASRANNIAPGQIDTGTPSSDVFLHPIGGGINRLVSHRATIPPNALDLQTVANGESFAPELSINGFYVAYESDATNLDPNQNDGNSARDVFLHNTRFNNSIMVSPRFAALAIGGNSQSIRPAISGEGYSVAFTGRSGDHIAEDPETSGFDDVFLFNTVTLPVVPFLSARSTASQNTLEWIMPPTNYVNMQAFVHTTSPCSFDFSDPGWSPLGVASPAANTSALFTDPTVYAPGTTRCYGIFIRTDAGPILGTDFPVRTVIARTLEDPTAAAKWASQVGSGATLTQVGIGTQSLITVGNLGSIHGLTRGPGGGFWPASFWPFRVTLNPIQGRPPVLPLGVLGSNAAVASARTTYVGSQDGRAYGYDSDKGARAGGALVYTSPRLGAVNEGVQGGPTGVFTLFGGLSNQVFAGGRTGSTGTFYALDPSTGMQLPGSPFTGGGPSIGPIFTSAAVDYTLNQVYFASLENAGGPSLWCLGLSTDGLGSTCWTQSSPTGISGGPVQRNGRVYVGDDNGQVWAFLAAGGSSAWAAPFTSCGGGSAIKSYVLADRQGTAQDLYYAAGSSLCGISDLGVGASFKWAPISVIPNPSAPILVRILGVPYLYVGSSNGRLYQINADNPSGAGGIKSVDLRVAGGAATIGPPSFDVFDNMVYVGASSGEVFAVQAPLP